MKVTSYHQINLPQEWPILQVINFHHIATHITNPLSWHFNILLDSLVGTMAVVVVDMDLTIPGNTMLHYFNSSSSSERIINSDQIIDSNQTIDSN